MSTSEFQKLLNSLSFDNLPGEEAHAVLSPLKTEVRSLARLQNATPKLSAVSLLLYDKANEPHFVLTKRHVYNGAHSGQISFPGGKKEDFDASHLHTALRETEEEIGVSSQLLTPIAPLTPTYIPPSGFLVYPFVLHLQGEPHFVAQEREVNQILEIKVMDLLHVEALKTTSMELMKGVRTKVPYFDLNGEVVWGATAMILNEFREVVLRG